jgi:uncharacterized protein YqeY
MSKEVEKSLSKEQNAEACQKILAKVSAMLTGGGITSTEDASEDVARALEFVEGKRGKNDGSKYAALRPTVKGCRFAGNIPADIVGIVVDIARQTFTTLMTERDAFQAKLETLRPAMAATPEGPGRDIVAKQVAEYQEAIEAVTRKLSKYSDAMREYWRAQREQLTQAVNKLSEEVEGLEKAVKHAPSLADLLAVKKNDLTHAQGKLAGLPQETTQAQVAA